ncbi:hypothetical protein WEH80_38680 [Actinomycetes bacterium KLBMP 9759]
MTAIHGRPEQVRPLYLFQQVRGRSWLVGWIVPPAGFEPALPPPEGSIRRCSGLLPATLFSWEVAEDAPSAVFDCISHHNPHHAPEKIHPVAGRSNSVATRAASLISQTLRCSGSQVPTSPVRQDASGGALMINVRSGDVIAVPVTGDQIAVAQIVARGRQILLAAFLDLHDARTAIDVATLDLDEPVLIGRIIGVAIEDGEWPVIGHRPVSPAIHVTTYKVGTSSGDAYHHYDVHDNYLGMIDHATARTLPTSSSSSDGCIPRAMRGLHDLGPWTRHDEELVAPRGHPTEPCDCQQRVALDQPAPPVDTATDSVEVVYRFATDDSGETGGYGTVAERTALFAIHERLAVAIDGVGEFDGNELGAGTATLFCSGDDGDALFAAARDVLAGLDLRPAQVTIRYSAGRSREITF